MSEIQDEMNEELVTFIRDKRDDKLGVVRSEVPKVFIFKIQSAGFNAGNYTGININDNDIQVGFSENPHYRGLHIFIFDPETGTCILGAAFDTYKSSKELEKFISKDHF